ncbi:citron Rho-interacting kinase-like [Argiope bruennichi]|uniref:citron Rho-interacting kinase-like n=1 Tax=Argiope bruennichi TaxID=94029 RepID=UPI002494E8C6|nr:citron Rho-interacting kinase-like [Argiope bruennichi]
MADQVQESIATRFMRLNQLILGKSNYNLPKKYLIHRDGLLDILFALYEECNVDYLRKDKHIAAFVDKFKDLMIELKSIRVNLRDFEVKKIIGRGHFGEVQVVREKATGDVYAMKVLRKQETLSQQNMAFYEEERDIMAKTTSPWLTKLQYAFQDNQHLYLIMEFHPGGDMLSLLEKYDNVLPEEMSQFYLAELVLAIHSLHSMGYVHRDIKPDNILIDRTGHIKLADFGSSSKLNTHKLVTSSMPVGTPDYVAPEVLTAMNAGPASSKSYGIECDWWSLGIVAYEMVFGSTPFTSDTVLVTYNNIMNFKNALKFPPEASEVSNEMTDLIKNLLEEPLKRLSYDKLIVHPLFTDIDWNNIRHTLPPYVPLVSGIDDTSNFDDFEPETRLYMSELVTKREFSGKNLPFVGFTYTTPFETLIERLSSSDDLGFQSPSTSFNEIDANSKRREMASLQKKNMHLMDQEISLKNEIKQLNAHLKTKVSEIEILKADKLLADQLIAELQNEVKQIKHLLGYERELKAITEKKASHLIRCMKGRQRQDALRLRAKSNELHHGEYEKLTLEEKLEEATLRMEEFLQEKTDLLEELYSTKHVLLECQQKLKEKEQQCLSTSDSYVSATSTSLNGSFTENSELHVATKKLVSKLEKKNVELEKELEAALAAKTKAESQVSSLKDVIVQLETKMAETEKEQLEASFQDLDEKVVTSIKKYESELESKGKIIAETQKKLLQAEEMNAELKQKIQELEADLKKLKDTNTKLAEKSQELENNLVPKRKVLDQGDSKLNQSIEKSPLWEKKLHSRNERQEMILLTSDLKQENDYLKTKIELLNLEVSKLKDGAKSREDLEKMLKEKEDELSEVKLDLRVSTRKEQQAESVTSSLRERNKELREKLRTTEEKLTKQIKIEEDLQEQLNSLQSTVTKIKEEIIQNEKAYEIEKVKLEERIKTMKDTWENSKDVNQKFAKTQGQYEEICRRNETLRKDCEEKDKKIINLLQENKILKNDLTTKQNEFNKYKQLNSILKSSVIDMEEDLKDFEIIVESRESTISELNSKIDKLEAENLNLKNKLKNSENGVLKEESQKEKLLKHINELTAELDNQNYLHEVEIQNLQENLSHYKKVVAELEDQVAQYQKEFSMQEIDDKRYSEKIIALENQLCEIKEEAARHITQISSLKSSNLKLTQALDEALDNQQENQKNIEELCNELENEKAKHLNEKVKLQETISQQIKLIDFLQSKTENMEKKKKTNISRLFGKKENTIQAAPPRDLEKLLETERSRCRRLQDQLSQARAEKMALQREISNLSKSIPSNTDIPVSPMSRAMHTAITASPSIHSDQSDNPIFTSKELLDKIIKPSGMKHRIPHRFIEIMCMRSTKCCTCLDSIHFGRQLVKCQECSVTCHPKCATSLPNTCGLPSEYMEHFKLAVQEQSTGKAPELKDGKAEGWIKVPKANKQGWDRKYLRLVDDILYVFENADDVNIEKASNVFDFGSGEAKIVVTSAVSPTELKFAATSDLPYVLKLESFPLTTCWPQRCLYIMTSNFNEKQMWVSVLENLAERNNSDINEPHKNKLTGKTIWTLESEKSIDPLCTIILDDNIMLLGAVEGLFALKIVNKSTCSLQQKLDGFSHVYQIACIIKIGVLILIHGEDRKLSLTDLDNFLSVVYGTSSKPISLQSVCDVKDCHLFAVEEMSSGDKPYICIASSNNVLLCLWDPTSKKFYSKKILEAKEPCSCILFTPRNVLFGADIFYELSLGSYSVKKFLDGSDASLAGLVYGASQFRSFPIAIFQVSTDGPNKEFLLCFHEMGVFVNNLGRKTRLDDIKWSRLPLAFAYRSPYLFITHFNAVEVIEIPPSDIPEVGVRSTMRVRNPLYMGPAYLQQSILISSTYRKTVELILIDGSSIGSSDFPVPSSDDATSVTYTETNSSEKESVGESEMVDLDFSFTNSMNPSDDRSSIVSKSSTESASSQN